jgi:hypothetical protein
MLNVYALLHIVLKLSLFVLHQLPQPMPINAEGMMIALEVG